MTGSRNFLLILLLLQTWLTSAQVGETKLVMIAWDASFSMENRVVENDIKFLDNYFKRNPDITVNLVIFSDAVMEDSNYQIGGGDWAPLKDKLKAVVYDGATDL
jgi:hypothetical protein